MPGSDQAIVRQAAETDLPAVLELWAVARSFRARTADTGEVLERLLARSPGSLLVAELEGRIVGVVIAAWDGWRGNFYRLAVLPQERRQGIALLLVREGERRLEANGARRISALVGRDDESAAYLWEAAGYEQDEQIGRFVKNVQGPG